MRVFINEKPFDVPDDSDTLAAIRAADVSLGERVLAGEAYVTDGRAIRVDLNDPLTPGAILRVVVSSRRSPDADT
ncbi:MAG: hypothetical protein ABI613_07425 [Gemmatimonadota bacterium]